MACMFDPLFLIVVLLIGPGLLLLIGVVVIFALRIKSPEEWPRLKSDEKLAPEDADA